MSWLLLACGPNKSSFLMDELRIVAMQSDPAELVIASTPDESTSSASINLLLTDPLSQGGSVMLWTCFDIGEGCLEGTLLADIPESWVQVQPLSRGTMTFPLSLPPSLHELLATLPDDFIPFTLANVWALTCAPGVCPLLEDAGSGSYDIGALSSPRDIMTSLPMEQTSLAYRSLILSPTPREEQIFNPILTFSAEQTGPRVVSAGEVLSLHFSYSRFPEASEEELASEEEDKALDGAVLYPFATAGEINRSLSDPLFLDETDGSFQISIDIPKETPAGTYHFFLSLENLNGGNDLWEGSFTVE